MFCRWDYVSISEEAAKDVKRNLNNWTFLLRAAFQFNNESWSACACLWPCCWVMTPVAIQPCEFNLLIVLQRRLTNLGMVHASTWDSLLPKILSMVFHYSSMNHQPSNLQCLNDPHNPHKSHLKPGNTTTVTFFSSLRLAPRRSVSRWGPRYLGDPWGSLVEAVNKRKRCRWGLPSGKLSHNYGKSPFLMGKINYK